MPYKITEEKESEIIRLRSKGRSMKSISKLARCSTETVRKIIDKFRLPRIIHPYKKSSSVKVFYSILQENEQHICSHFGCGKELTIEQQLYGNKCTTHSRKQLNVVDSFIQV